MREKKNPKQNKAETVVLQELAEPPENASSAVKNKAQHSTARYATRSSCQQPEKKTGRNENVPPVTSAKDPNLEIGTINLKLHIPGLLDLIIPVPVDPKMSIKQWSHEFYDQFRGKYWIKIPRYNYKCLICGREYAVRDFLLTHLNHHLGFQVARCIICSKSYYSMTRARVHAKHCKKEVDHE